MSKLTSLLAIAITLASTGLFAQDKPASLILNGGYERGGGWSKPANASYVDSDRAGRCLMMTGAGGATQDLLPEGGYTTLSCSVEVKTEDIVPGEGNGYAYVAVYQLNAQGNWVAYKDFATLKGTNDWQRYDYTFDLVPNVATISVRCGIFNASGEAWFDNWTLVPGNAAYGYEDVSAPGVGRTPEEGRVAIFREDGFPVKGAASSPERLGKLLSDAGLQVQYLSADDLANSSKLNSGLFNIALLPYGQSFPAVARQNFMRFLRSGGSFISTGGYAFENLLVNDGGKWISEKVSLEQRLEAALKESVIVDSGFETTAGAPVGGTELDAKWRRDGDQCVIVEENPKTGKRCAKVTVDIDAPREERWYLDIAPERGSRYRVSGWVKTDNVVPNGTGFAYIALYEYGDENKLGKWRDFAQVTGTTGWQQFSYDFSPAASTTRLHVKMGLYSATGTAWFDDIRLANITGMEPVPMNTSTGTPADGLNVAPSQIGVFDASYPLRRASIAMGSDGQFIFPADKLSVREMDGWAAAGVQGYDNARWVSLIDGHDRFDRPRGSVAALMINYNGFYSGSMWGYFGVENRDLFDGSEPAFDRGLVELAKFMVRGLYLRNLKTDQAAYRPGEPVKMSMVVENNGAVEQSCKGVFAVFTGNLEAHEPSDTHTIPFSATVAPGSTQLVEAECRASIIKGDLIQVKAILRQDSKSVDEMTTGFIMLDDEVASSGPELRFHDNYFHLDGEPLFLFGADTYSYTYNSSHENPWTWHLDHVAARDYGFNVYENLQYSKPGYVFDDSDWRKFEGMAQSCQKHGLVFMPCQLVGHNVAISDELLETQAKQCEAYGEHMRQYPGLLYYLNGDFRLDYDDRDALKKLWSDWLAEKYESAGGLAASWGDEVYGEWGAMDYPPPPSRTWESVRECDRRRFEAWLTTRWVSRHVEAVKTQDTDHPITSEYYRQPFGGMDLVLSIDGMDASNIGYFDVPYRDIDYLPLALRLTDLRMRGKSLGLGEYGVKTHPAWTVENGATGYHIVRTEEEQKRLFMAVAHYGLGLGACKVQNWCLRDASHSIFPWGVFYPNGRQPKDVAYWHRNLSLVWRHMRPVYEAPETAVLIPDGMRLGAHDQRGVDIAYTSFRALLQLGVNFNVINEEHIDALTAETKTLIWPSPFCPSDACYEKVLGWVRDGGRLIVTGDISFNWDRKRTRTKRLAELCGVQFVKELYRPPARPAEGAQITEVPNQHLRVPVIPCIEVKLAGAEVVSKTPDGTAVRFRNKVGEGWVLYCTDPIEMGSMDDVVPGLRWHYLSAMGADTALWPTGPTGPVHVPPDDIHVLHQPLKTGGEFTTVFNTNMPPAESKKVWLPAGDADVVVEVAPRYSAFTATAGDQLLVGVGCSGQATFDSQPLIDGDAQVMYLSLDGRPLNVSEGVLLCPFSAGKTRLHTRNNWSDTVVLVGDVVDGKWETYETIDGSQGIDLDQDRMTCLFLICRRDLASRFTEHITEAVNHPQRVKGY